MSGKVGRSKLRSSAEKAKSRLHCRFEWPVVEGITSFNPMPSSPLRFRAPASPLFCQLKPQTGRLPRVISWRRIVTAIRKFREFSARLHGPRTRSSGWNFTGHWRSGLCYARWWTLALLRGYEPRETSHRYRMAIFALHVHGRNNGRVFYRGDCRRCVSRACNLMLIMWKIVCIRDNGCYPLCEIIYNVAITRCCHLSKN